MKPAKPENENDKARKTQRFFVHPQLDDLGLPLAPYRVYSHLLRRAGTNGKCTTSIDSICRLCGINRKTVFKALKHLADRKLIERSKKFGGCNRYHIPWPPKVPNRGTDGVAEVAHQSPHETAHKGILPKDVQDEETRASDTVTDSEFVELGKKPNSIEPENPHSFGISLSMAKQMAREIWVEERAKDPYGDFALFQGEDYDRWAEDWLLKIEQSKAPFNAYAALRGYLRKATHRNTKKFKELQSDSAESIEDNCDPPF